MATIQFFGKFADIVGEREAEHKLHEPLSVRELMEQLAEQNPALRDVFAETLMQVAVNDSISSVDHIVSGGDVIAFLPPMSGG